MNFVLYTTIRFTKLVVTISMANSIKTWSFDIEILTDNAKFLNASVVTILFNMFRCVKVIISLMA